MIYTLNDERVNTLCISVFFFLYLTGFTRMYFDYTKNRNDERVLSLTN